MHKLGMYRTILAMLCFASPVRADESPFLLPFQGRISGTPGSPLQDGPRLIRFRISDSPDQDSFVWTGELHKVSINEGLINVFLGTKNPLQGINFGRQLFLEITVDLNGNQRIEANESPLSPRQAILPVLFAYQAGDSRKLAGHDWSALFTDGSGNPATAKISGSKLLQGSVPAEALGPDSIRTTNLTDGAVLPEKLFVRTLASDAAIGQIAVSDGVTFTPAPVPPPGTPIPVPNLSLNITTRGGPVRIRLIPARRGIARLEASAQSEENCSVTVYFIRDDLIIAAFETTRYGTSRINEAIAWEALDDPPKGTHNYHVLIRGESNGNRALQSLTLREIRLAAHEL